MRFERQHVVSLVLIPVCLCARTQHSAAQLALLQRTQQLCKLPQPVTSAAHSNNLAGRRLLRPPSCSTRQHTESTSHAPAVLHAPTHVCQSTAAAVQASSPLVNSTARDEGTPFHSSNALYKKPQAERNSHVLMRAAAGRMHSDLWTHTLQQLQCRQRCGQDVLRAMTVHAAGQEPKLRLLVRARVATGCADKGLRRCNA